MISCPEKQQDSITAFNLTTANDNEQVKLDTSVVEQLVLAAVASLPTPTSTIQPPPTMTPMDITSTISTPTTTNTTSTPVELALNFTDAQLEQINAAQAQAISQAAANYQHLFATLENSNNNNPPTTSNNKKETTAITQKVRQENRERKKRWRQQNQERNKDNDLRCRVNKRAHKLFGKEDSPHKQKWIEDEFSKRRTKRRDKEVRKQSSNEDEIAAFNGLLNDPAGYISMLANNLSSLAHASASLDKVEGENKDDVKSEQFTTQLLEFLQQQQQNEFDAVMNQAEHIVDPGTEDDVDVEMEETLKQEEQEVLKADIKSEEEANKEESGKVDYPMDAVLTLMQLNAGWRQ